MSKKETFAEHPTSDKVAQSLAGIEEATIEEEEERKRRGLTLEPEAKRIKNNKLEENITEEAQDDRIERAHVFLLELNKWENNYLSVVPDTRDLPMYLHENIKISNQNPFKVSPLFIDYLIGNSAEKLGRKKLDKILDELSGVLLMKISNLKDTIALQLYVGDKVKFLLFENEYPFRFLNMVE